MTSIFQHALGSDFNRLHPMLHRRFEVGLDAGYACIGRGTMLHIRRGPWWTIPFLRIGKIRNILIPDFGRNAPFTIWNYPYLGTPQHLAVDLDLSVEPDGSLRLLSGAQRFYEGPVAFRFPMLFSGHAELRESYDDAAGVYRINLDVRNSVCGFWFGYEREFSCHFIPASDAPARLKPRRHERRL